ncbi:MAG: response regulator [Bacteroidetes bacterium]|nr:response regulator [Bacteroidota bacterium]
MQTLNKTALIVDDDIDYLSQMKMTVSNFGFNVITANSQKEAEEIILKNKPDIAILDLMMENQDSGFVLSYMLKKKYPDVPVIIATAVTAETGFMFGLNTAEEKQWIKADLYLEKGLRADQLQKEMFKLLKI